MGETPFDRDNPASCGTWSQPFSFSLAHAFSESDGDAKADPSQPVA
jgi:hypothetical protein